MSRTPPRFMKAKSAPVSVAHGLLDQTLDFALVERACGDRQRPVDARADFVLPVLHRRRPRRRRAECWWNRSGCVSSVAEPGLSLRYPPSVRGGPTLRRNPLTRTSMRPSCMSGWAMPLCAWPVTMTGISVARRQELESLPRGVMCPSRMIRSLLSFSSAAYLRAVSITGIVCHCSIVGGDREGLQVVGHGADHGDAQSVDIEDDVRLFGEQLALGADHVGGSRWGTSPSA